MVILSKPSALLIVRFSLSLKDFIYLFLGRGKGREKERERNIDIRNIDWLLLVQVPTWGQMHNPDMCTDLQLNC